MRTGLYAVLDNVAGEIFGGIIRAANNEVARRAFEDLLRQKESPIANHKGDYDLHCLGYIDNLGIIDALDQTLIVMKGADWLEANKEA